jgi:hypothetical protein
MKNVVAGCVCILIGCAAGAAIPAVTAQSFGPNPSAQRWEQYCEWEDRSRSAMERLSATIRQRGMEGWELAEVHYDVYMSRNVACFKRPASQ